MGRNSGNGFKESKFDVFVYRKDFLFCLMQNATLTQHITHFSNTHMPEHFELCDPKCGKIALRNFPDRVVHQDGRVSISRSILPSKTQPIDVYVKNGKLQFEEA